MGGFCEGEIGGGKSTPPEAGQAHIYYLLSRAKTVEGARNTAALYGFVHRGGKLSFCFDADMGNPCGKGREQYADTQIVRGGRQPRRRAVYPLRRGDLRGADGVAHRWRDGLSGVLPGVCTDVAGGL